MAEIDSTALSNPSPVFRPPKSSRTSRSTWFYGFPIRSRLLNSPNDIDSDEVIGGKYIDCCSEIFPDRLAAIRLVRVLRNAVDDTCIALVSLGGASGSGPSECPLPRSVIDKLKVALFEIGLEDDPGWFPAH